MNETVKALAESRRQLRAHVKAVEKNRRRINRELRKIQRDLDRLYPDDTVIEAVDMLCDLDYVWRGDFDKLREPLADLIIEANRAGMFPSHINEINRILLKHED